MKWEVLHRPPITDHRSLVKILLKNRGIKDEKEFFHPQAPEKIELEAIGIRKLAIKKVVERIKEAKKNKEKVIVYGDYDADGICATAIIWEYLYGYSLDVLPHVPDRFSEGYGINAKSVENLKSQISNLKLIITVDNGIVAYEGIKKAKELGIDVIVIDHHTKGRKKLPTSYILHLTSLSGAGLAYFFVKTLITDHRPPITNLDLAAIGTIADQMPLIGVNRSLVKYGLKELESTRRPGLRALFTEAGIKQIGTYEVNYLIAPRINAMGRISHGLHSLRLLCTKNQNRAFELARHLNQVNQKRQKIVEEVVSHARSRVKDEKILVLAGDYHEGVIGLAASRLTEEFYRPAIVFSQKKDVSKASARSIPGVDIISIIRELDDLILEGGGHPMAAGFSIETAKIEVFSQKINEIAGEILTDELLEKKLRIDAEINFAEINFELVEIIKQFEPFGSGNPTPTFMSKKVELLESRAVGKNSTHLKLKLRQGDVVFDAIYFNAPTDYQSLVTGHFLDLAYQIEENVWNSHRSIQLKIKDLRLI